MNTTTPSSDYSTALRQIEVADIVNGDLLLIGAERFVEVLHTIHGDNANGEPQVTLEVSGTEGARREFVFPPAMDVHIRRAV